MTLTQLCSRLARRGHHVEVFYPKASTTAPKGGVILRELPGFQLPGYPEVRLALPRQISLLKEWRENPPDAVYIATEGMLGSSALRVARKLRIRVVSGYHTHFPQYLRHYNLPLLEPLALRYLRRWHNKCAMTLTPAPDVASMLSTNGFKDVQLLGRGVDCDLFSPDKRDSWLRRQWNAGQETPVMLCVGRVAPEKNLALAMDSYQRLKSRFPDLKLVMVGDGPSRPDLQAQDRSIYWVGMQQGEALAKHYASADMFLFPSLTETYGNVLAEAMASGLVSVSFDYAASSQLVSNGIEGFQVPRGDADAFHRAVEQALSSRQLWGAISAAARAATLPLSWEAVVDTFETALSPLTQSINNSPDSLAHELSAASPI